MALQRVLALPIEGLELIVVDDGSTDLTPVIIAEAALTDQRIHAIRLSTNSGKTAAVRQGVRHAQGQVIIIQDADLEYDAAEIPRLIEPILKGTADVVYGSRFLARPSRGNWPFSRYWGNRALTALSNCFTPWKLTDVETCYKAFRAPLLKRLELTSRRFGMEIETTALASRTTARFLELPISYAPRTVAHGKKLRYRDGLWAIYYVVRYNALACCDSQARRYIQSASQEIDYALEEKRCDVNQDSSAPAVRSSDAHRTRALT